MARLRSGNAPPSATADATRRPALREKTNTTGTPGPAVETSMLALKNFKRRPRQGSMLEMVRSRRSSVARQSIASVQPQEEHENTSVFDLGSASEDEEHFAPEAEGTPVHVNKTKKPASTRKSLSATKSNAPASATRRNKRKSDEMETSHSALDTLRKKHRKSEAPPMEDEPLPEANAESNQAAHISSDHQMSPLPVPASDVQVLNSSPESTPPTEPSSSAHEGIGQRSEDFAVPSTEEQERQQSKLDAADDFDAPNATMAEPASSSPIASPIPETQRTDIYADPLTQVSPPPPEPAKTRRKGDAKRSALSTATLRALLPKRTLRPQPRLRRTEYDISSDDGEDEQTAFDTTHLDDDEDELGGRLQRKAKASAQTKGRKKPAATTKAKPKPKTTAKKPPPAAKSKGKATRTYGRSAASDKENERNDSAPEQEDEEETSMTMHEVAHSKELEEARRKFAEVDEWDLSFESMSNEDHRSSSQNWR